jgi:hypothetical protein
VNSLHRNQSADGTIKTAEQPSRTDEVRTDLQSLCSEATDADYDITSNKTES